MSDLIERQAAIDALDKRFDNVPMEQTAEILLLRKDLRNLPSAQPELVRCRDCKFCKTYYHGAESNLGMFTYECIRGLYTVTADEFCSKAERKEE